MKTAFLILALVAASPVTGLAQNDWQTQLRANLVAIRGTKMIYEEFGIYKLTIPGYESTDYQTKIYAEAPATDVISRDNFVAFTTMLSNTSFMLLFAEAYNVSASVFLENFHFEELANPIGKPDLEVNIFMTAQGYQLEIVNNNNGEKNRVTQTWKELLGTGS